MVISSLSSLISMNLACFNIQKLLGGISNHTYLVTIGQSKWVFRIGCSVTSNVIDRNAESFNASLAASYEINVPIEWSNPKEGYQLTKYVPSIPFNEINKDTENYKTSLKKIANILKKLHSIDTPFTNNLDIFEVNKSYLKKIKEERPAILPSDFKSIIDFLDNLKSLFEKFDYSFVPCHNDTTPSNFLILDEEQSSAENYLYLIDWEYSGNNDKLWDLVYFGIEANLDDSNFKLFLENYFEEVTPEINTWIAVYKPFVSATIALWDYYQIVTGPTSCKTSDYHELAKKYYDKTLDFLNDDVIKKSLENLDSMQKYYYQGNYDCSHKAKFPRKF